MTFCICCLSLNAEWCLCRKDCDQRQWNTIFLVSQILNKFKYPTPELNHTKKHDDWRRMISRAFEITDLVFGGAQPIPWSVEPTHHQTLAQRTNERCYCVDRFLPLIIRQISMQRRCCVNPKASDPFTPN